MDAMSDPRAHTVVGVFASQTGKTDVTLNAVGFHIHQDPAPILVIQPTLSMAEAWSKDRLAPMLRDTPALRGKVQDPRARDSGNTLLHKSFPGGHLTVAGANSPASLASRPIRIVICDEVDRYPRSAGTEGDSVKLAETRSSAFWNAKLILISSPGTRGISRIDGPWKKSDQRVYLVPCPDCGHFQVLRWAQVHWQKDELGGHLPETAVYACEHCGSAWSDAQRWAAVRRGHWKATKPFNGIAGFRLNALNVPWERRKLSRLVDQWLEAQGNPELLKVFVNTVLAEWWESEEGESVDETGLLSRREDWNALLPRGAELPDGVAVLTMGVDVQRSPARVEYEVVGWGEGEESWSIAHGKILGDVKSDARVLEELDQVMLRPWIHAKGIELYIRGVGIDTGYATQVMYRFCKPRFTRPLPNGLPQFVFAMKGRSEFGRRIWPETATQQRRLARINLWVIGVDAAKEQIYSRLAIANPGRGYCHFPLDRPRSYFEQLTAEQSITKYRAGQKAIVWELKQEGRPNEALDLRVYAYAAMVGLQEDPFLLNLQAEVERLDTMEPRRIEDLKASAVRASEPAPSRRLIRSKGVEA